MRALEHGTAIPHTARLFGVPSFLRARELFRSLNRRGRLALAVGGSAAVAVGLVLLMPRGPVTATQALIALVCGLALGVVTGYVMRSRWAMLVAPVVVAVAFELRWVWVDGPTVDAPRFDTTYGFLAIILGRGFLFFVCTVPLLLGVTLGAGLARGHDWGRRPDEGEERDWAILPAERLLVVVAIGVAALGLLHRPPGHDAGDHRTRTATLFLEASRCSRRCSLPGGDQWISIRGYSQNQPSPPLPARRARPERNALHALPLQRHRQGLRRG